MQSGKRQVQKTICYMITTLTWNVHKGQNSRKQISVFLGLEVGAGLTEKGQKSNFIGWWKCSKTLPNNGYAPL
jgi:hypothetical protein